MPKLKQFRRFIYVVGRGAVDVLIGATGREDVRRVLREAYGNDVDLPSVNEIRGFWSEWGSAFGDLALVRGVYEVTPRGLPNLVYQDDRPLEKKRPTIDEIIRKHRERHPDVKIEKLSRKSLGRASGTDYFVIKDGVSVYFDRRGYGSWEVKLDNLQVPIGKPKGGGSLDAAEEIECLLTEAIRIVLLGRDKMKRRLEQRIAEKMRITSRKLTDLEKLQTKMQSFESMKGEEKINFRDDFAVLCR